MLASDVERTTGSKVDGILSRDVNGCREAGGLVVVAVCPMPIRKFMR